MPWYAPWSESIKKRACRYLLQRYLGCFLEEKLTLDQLSVDLYRGTGTVSDLALDTEAINELGDSQNWALQIVDGYMQKISVSIPWSTLLKDDSVVEVYGLSVTVQPKMRAEPGSSMLESMWSSMSSSMQLAAECLQADAVPDAQPVEGIEMFAHAIDSILSRVKVKFINTKIRIEHVPKNSDTGIALEIHIRNIDYLDEAGSEPPSELIDSEQNKTYVVSTFTSKRIAFEGVTFFTDEYPSKARTISRSLVMERSLMTQSVKAKTPEDVNVESVLSDVYYESRSTFDAKSREGSVYMEPANDSSENTLKFESSPDEEKPSHNEPILFAKLIGRQELSLKIKQSDEATGPKVNLQLTLGSLILFLSPRQLHILLELANGLSSPHLEDTSNMPLRTGGLTECKPMRAADFQRVEAQLIGTLAPPPVHHLNARGWSGHSLDDSDQESEKFHPLTSPSGNTMSDSCNSSVSSMSASATSSVSGFANTPAASHARIKRNRKVPQIDGDPTAEVFHMDIRVASCSCILLHKDILIPTPVGTECILPASAKKMHLTACDFFDKLGFFAVSGYGNKDFELANQMFDKATTLSHLRLISTSLTLDGSEKTTSQGCQTTGHLTVARLHLRECLYQADSPGGRPTLESCDLVHFDRNAEGSNAEEAFANPLGGLPDVKLAFKQTQKATRIAGEKKLVYPTTDICVTCSACSVQVDVTLLDRLTDVRHGGAPCAPRAAPPQPPAATSPAEHQRSFSLHCPHLSAILRFPIVELRAGVSRETRRVRPDYVLCALAGVEVTSTQASAARRPAPLSVHLNSHCVNLYYHENDSDPGTHIARATGGESVDPNILTGSDTKIPSVSLTFLPTKSNKGPFDSSSDEEPQYEHGAGNPMTHSIHLMDQLKDNSNPSPFSSKKMVHQSDTARDNLAGDVEELVVPGSAQEMHEFTQHATARAAVHLACCLPNLSLQLLSKQLYEVLYNRINTDLMLWEPWVPERAAFPPHASIQPLLHLPEPNIYPAFAACKSALDYDSDTASSSSSDDNVYYSTYESRAKHKRLAARVDAHGKALHDFCLTLRVHDGLLTIFTPVRDGSNRVVPGQAGELQIAASRLSMCQVSGVRGRAKHALMCLRAHTATLFHAPLVPSSSERPSLHLHGSRPEAHMAETIYPSGSGVTLNENNSKDVLSLAIGVEPHKDLPNFKKIRVALGMERATLRHRGAHGTAWLNQLLDQLDVLDYPVPGYRPSTVLTELHVHLWDCAVDYRPLYLPIRSVITLGSFSVSSNVIANTNTSNLRFIAQECALFLMQAAGKAGQPVPLDDDKPVDLQKNYVCVLDLGLFELSLRMTDKNNRSGPQVELRASNNVVHARTCWDSASALGRLLTYVAATGDAQPPAPDTPHSSVCSDRADALLVGVDEKLPEEIRELSPSEVQQVHDLMAEAMKESPNSTATDEELAKSGEKEGVEVFFFPDESNPKRVENPTLSREPSDASSEPREQGLEPGEENYFEAEKEEAPTIAQVARELGDPTANTDAKKPERQAKTSEDGNTDDEFCVVERSGAEDEELAEPTVRWLSSEPVPMLENHFAVPLAKTDVLRPPKNFPTPILRYTLCEMSVIWHMYGGNDFKQPSEEPSAQSKKHVTINQHTHSPTPDKRGASYEPYETSRQTAAAYLQRGVAWGRGEGLRPGGAPPAARRLAAWRQRGGPQRDLHTHVEIQLNKVKFQHESYGAGLAQAARQTLAVGKLEVRDRLAASDINKFLSHHVSKEEPERRHAHMVVVKAVHLRPEPALAAQECCLKVSLLPLRFHIDQDTLLFLVHFFSKLGSDPDTAAASEEETRSAGGTSSDASSPKVTPTHRPPVMSLATHLRAQPPPPAPPTPAPSPDTLSLNSLPLEDGGQPLLETYEAERMVSDNLIQLEEEWRVGAGAGAGAAPSSLSNTTTTSAQPDPDASPLYFRRVVFAPDVPIRLDYVGKRVDLSAGPVAGLLMGLGQLNCSELRLKRLYHRHGILGVERLVRWALQEWLSDIKRHQLPGLLSGIGPMHSLLQLLTGMRDLLWLPVEQWRRDGRLVHGLRRGAASFTARTAVAALDITARILHIIQATAETALDMLTPGPTLQLQGAYEQRRRRRRRRNDPSRQPTDIREGVANAVQIVREGIAETAETMSLAARSERGVGGVLRHLPGAAVAPLALAAAGAADVLGGVRSQLVPHHRRHHTDKWRVHTDQPDPH